MGRMEQVQVAQSLRASLPRSTGKPEQRTDRAALPRADALVAEKTAAQEPTEQSARPNSSSRPGRILAISYGGAGRASRSRAAPEGRFRTRRPGQRAGHHRTSQVSYF